jgi:outer membrane receptor for ferrienterochelin and colicins
MISWSSSAIRCTLSVALACALATAPSLGAQQSDGTIVGQVTDERGGPVAHVEVMAQRDERRIERAVTDGQGRYRMSVSPGVVRVVIPDGAGILPVESAAASISSGNTVTIDLVVQRQVFDLDQIVVSPGRTDGEELSGVMGMITSVKPAAIRRNVSVTPTDVVAKYPGVDHTETGISGRTFAFRGFGNIFSGAVRYLVDYRQASIPSLRANFPHFVPTGSSDMESIEMILGPSSAIYGPNAAPGVMNVLTRSPLDLPETYVAVSGGTNDILQTEIRTSQRLGERVGLKVSGSWFEGTEYVYADPVEIAEAARIETAYADWEADLLDLGVRPEEIPIRAQRVGMRDRGIERWTVDGRLDWTPFDGDTLYVQAGRTSSSGVEVTPIGAAQAQEWNYDYVQGRFTSGALFATAYLNRSDAGQTFLLRDGATLVDNSQMVGLMARHGFSFADGAEEITYGGDWTRTTPKTGGTIHGRYEAEDEITEYGGFVQSRTRIFDGLDLLGTLRLDESNTIEDPVLSPRVGIVARPAEGHTFTASWSRGFSTPTPTNYFLDISGGTAPDELGLLGYRGRAMGTGRDGIRFSDGQGGYQGMRSPCTPGALGGPSALVPATPQIIWPCAVTVMEQQGEIDPATAAFLRTLSPDVTVNAVDPQSGQLTALTPGAVDDIAPLVENTTTTTEVGYRGLIGGSLFLQAAVWHTRRDDFTSPLVPLTPLLTLDGEELAAYLVSQGLPAAQAAALAEGAATIPGGVLSSSDIQGMGPELVLSYENYGTLSYWGMDLGAQLELNRNFTLAASGSLVSEDHFEVEGRIVTLNAPDLKGSASLIMSGFTVPVTAEIGVRGHSGFPVSSGEFVGLQCLSDFEGAADSDECVDTATLLDASIGYEGLFGGIALRVGVKNLLDTAYRPFVGVPTSGRQILARMEYRLR